MSENAKRSKDYLKACEEVGTAMLKLMDAGEILKGSGDPVVKVISANTDLLHDLMGRLKQKYWELDNET